MQIELARFLSSCTRIRRHIEIVRKLVIRVSCSLIRYSEIRLVNLRLLEKGRGRKKLLIIHEWFEIAIFWRMLIARGLRWKSHYPREVFLVLSLLIISPFIVIATLPSNHFFYLAPHLIFHFTYHLSAFPTPFLFDATHGPQCLIYTRQILQEANMTYRNVLQVNMFDVLEAVCEEKKREATLQNWSPVIALGKGGEGNWEGERRGTNSAFQGSKSRKGTSLP